MTAVARKRNVPGYIDGNGVFRPIRSASYVGSGSSRRRAKVSDRKKYSRAKAGDLGPAKQERALEDPWDRENRLEREAAAKRKREQDRIERQIAAEAFGDNASRKNRGKGQTLAQFIRSEGGLRRTFRHDGQKFRGKRSSWDSGEIDAFSRKESGTTGLTTSDPRRGKTIDMMWQAAREAGFDIGDPNEMLGMLDNEIHGGKKTYATSGSMTYNPAKLSTAKLRNAALAAADAGEFAKAAELLAKAVKAYPAGNGALRAADIAAMKQRIADYRSVAKKNPIKILKHKFYVGQKLATRSIGNHDVIYRGTVVSRTPKFVTVKIDGDRELKRCGVKVYENSEYIFPFGRYSMAPTFTAAKGDRVGNPASLQWCRCGHEKDYHAGGKCVACTCSRFAKANPASAARLAKAAISVFDNDLDLDVDARDVRRLQKGEKAIRRKKKNPDVLGMFANAAVGVASALQIKEYMNRPKRQTKRKTNGTTTAKRRKTAKNPSQTSLFTPSSLNVLTIRTGDKVDAVYLHEGRSGGFNKLFKTMAAAKSYATRNKIKLVENPSPKVNGIVSRAWARSKAKREYGRELRQSAALERTRKRRKAAESKAAENPARGSANYKQAFGLTASQIRKAHDISLAFWNSISQAARNQLGREAMAAKTNPRVIQLPVGFKWEKTVNAFNGGDYFNILDPHGLIVGWGTTKTSALKTFKKTGSKARARRGFSKARAKQIREGARSLKIAVRNPKTTARRRTYEMFQGRPATKVTPMQVSHHAPARLDALGDLVEIKMNGGPTYKFNRGVKLCAANGKLWIAGKRFAKPNPSAKLNEINPIGEIDHVVYGTYKPHHGDHNYTHYIHKLGEESGVMPTLCVDREGFPVIRGGNYKIESRGIVD